MPVPYMAQTMRGWTKKKTVKIITQTVADFETVEAETETTMQINMQPVPPAQVARKPEEQRTWKWWSLIVIKGQALSTDDIIVIDGKNYRVQNNSDWSESGFRKYEVIEDYTRE